MYHQFFRAISFFVSLLLVTHWVACFWITIGCPHVRESCVPTGWANFAGDIHSYTTFTPLGKYMCARHAMDMIVCLFVLCIQNYYICFQPAYMYIQSTYYIVCVTYVEGYHGVGWYANQGWNEALEYFKALKVKQPSKSETDFQSFVKHSQV